MNFIPRSLINLYFIFVVVPYIINNIILFFQISELKRINKLIRDQDFYALKKIKIPVVRYGCVQEQIEKDETDIASAYISANAGELSSYKIIFLLKFTWPTPSLVSTSNIMTPGR